MGFDDTKTWTAQPTDSPYPSCAALRTGDSVGNFQDLFMKGREISAQPQKGENYSDLAELYLKGAVREADDGLVHDTGVVLNGSAQGRARSDATGKPRGYDGVHDALRLAQEHGADRARLEKLGLCSSELNQWVNENKK